LKFLNIVTSLLAVVLLNGCLEVEDNSSDVKALIEQSKNSVNIKGVVVDALDFEPINNALITVKIGSTEFISNFEVTDGSFELTGLPDSSDIDIIVSSPDNTFLSRTFFAETGYGSTNGFDDLGNFAVSESIDVNISVIDNTTNNAFTKLTFTAYSHSNSNAYSTINSAAYKYQHVSSFNEETGIYTITLPKFIETSISANLDFDKDGDIDYVPELNNFLRGRDLYLGAANTKEFTTIYIDKVQESSAIEVRLSLVDESAQPLLGAKFYIQDSAIDSVYDELTNQYVISALLKDTLSLQLPAFTSNEVYYQSSAFTVSKLNDGNLSITKVGGYNNCCFVIPSTDVIDFALAPQVILESETPLEVVLAASAVKAEDSSFSVFYSQAIVVETESISLTNEQGFSVLKGNSDTNDAVAPGTTLITGGLSFPVTFTLSLNDTRLTVTPLSPLTVADSYQYDIKTVMNKASLESEDIYNDNLTFEIEDSSGDIFSIEDIKLDNENYTSNGVAFIASNSAGELASPSNWSNYAQLYLPVSIHSLQKLTLRRTSLIRNGVSSVEFEDYNVVYDGVINAVAVGVVSLAENESVNNQSYNRSVIVKSAQAETQKVYRVPTWVYMSDNVNAETNSISFEYTVETKNGDVSTGNITLPVQ
jgi:hypothetical protein